MRKDTVWDRPVGEEGWRHSTPERRSNSGDANRSAACATKVEKDPGQILNCVDKKMAAKRPENDDPLDREANKAKSLWERTRVSCQNKPI